MTLYTKRKAKLCPCGCGRLFVPTKSIQKYYSPSCETKVKTGRATGDLNNVSLSMLHDMARGVFHEYIRLRDQFKACVCCGVRIEQGQLQAGHFMKAELFSGVEFDEINVNGQSLYCNQVLHGNTDNYEKGLVIRYGVQAVEDLKMRANLSRMFKHSKDELIGIVEQYRTKVEQLKDKRK